MLDLGDRFRLLVNEVDAVEPPGSRCRGCRWRGPSGRRGPTCQTAAAAWIYAGGPHHTVFSQALTSEPIEDLAEMLGIECLRIDGETRLADFENQFRWNQAAFSA